MQPNHPTEKATADSQQQLVMPLFLYLKTCKLEKAMLQKLKAAGYVPIAVDSFDDVKIVEPLPLGSTNGIIRAAFSTIAESEWASVKEKFGNKVARTLAA